MPAALRCCLRDADLYGHSEQGVECADEAADDGGRLTDLPHDSDRDQVGAADAAIGRVEGDPARARYEDFGPRVGRAGTERPSRRGMEVPRHDPSAEAETACRLGEEHGEVAA